MWGRPKAPAADHLADRGEVERHPEGGEFLDHRLAARVAVHAEALELRLHPRLLGVEEEAEDVHVVAVAARRELARRDGHEARPFRRGLELGEAVERVVVREREDRQARLDRVADEARGRVDAVGKRRMAVQVGAAERGHPGIVAREPARPAPVPFARALRPASRLRRRPRRDPRGLLRAVARPERRGSGRREGSRLGLRPLRRRAVEGGLRPSPRRGRASEHPSRRSSTARSSSTTRSPPSRARRIRTSARC